MPLSHCGSLSTDQQGRELIQHGSALFPLACYHDNLSESPVPWHWHEELEVLLLESGSARAAVGGRDYTLSPGEGFFFNSGVLHAVWPQGTGPCRLRSIVFHPRLVGGSVDSIIWQKYLEPLLADPCRPGIPFTKGQDWEQEAVEAIQGAWQACVSETEGYELLAREQLSRLIFLLAKHCPTPEKKPSERSLRAGERVKGMLQYIQEHYDQELSLGAIAASAAISENECLRCFRSVIGSTPIQYLKELRIQKAAELLRSTDRKISDIGAACGFQEMSYFAKTFRALLGSSPGDYRRNQSREK